jgi:hypothetical protein
MTFVECINRWLADIDLQLHVSKQFGIEIKGHGWTLSESELIPSTLETRSGERRTEMYRVDITADLNDEDEAGYVWTFLDEARDPGRSSQAPSSLPGIKMPLAGGWCPPEHCACCYRSPDSVACYPRTARAYSAAFSIRAGSSGGVSRLATLARGIHAHPVTSSSCGMNWPRPGART